MAYNYNRSAVRDVADDYANLRTIPALLGALFGVLSFFTFGAIDAITWNWFVEYTLTAEHAAIGSLIVYVIAFMSSETKQWESYTTAEKGAIGSGIVLIFGHEYIGAFQTHLFGPYDPHMSVLALVIAVLGYIVAVR